MMEFSFFLDSRFRGNDNTGRLDLGWFAGLCQAGLEASCFIWRKRSCGFIFSWSFGSTEQG